MATGAMGRFRHCCFSPIDMTDEKGHPLILGRENFQEAWNSHYMRSVRRKMIEGKPVKGCEACYEIEAIGEKSHRKINNEDWSFKLSTANIRKVVDNSVKEDFEVHQNFLYLDLRLGSLCNLKCRMCDPHNSVQIQNEWSQLDQKTGHKYSEFLSEYKQACVDPRNDWCESEKFWEDVESHIPYLKKVYMTGGEPTLIKGVYRFLERCHELDKSAEIELLFNTNMTNMTDLFLNSTHHFKYTHILASLDGFGHVNEYIRFPSRWKIIEKNIEKLLSLSGDKVGIGISMVLQVYNVLDIVPLLDFSIRMMMKHKKKFSISPLTCFDPKFLNPLILPKNIKMEAICRLEEFKNRLPSYSQAPLMAETHLIIKSLKGHLEKEDPRLINDFFVYTKILDQHRGQSFVDRFPDLVDLFCKAGYDYNTFCDSPMGRQVLCTK